MTKVVNKLLRQSSFDNDMLVYDSDNFKITVAGVLDKRTGERKHFDFEGAHNLVCYGCKIELKNKKATRYQVKKLFRKLMVVILRHAVDMANDVIKGR